MHYRRRLTLCYPPLGLYTSTPQYSNCYSSNEIEPPIYPSPCTLHSQIEPHLCLPLMPAAVLTVTITLQRQVCSLLHSTANPHHLSLSIHARLATLTYTCQQKGQLLSLALVRNLATFLLYTCPQYCYLLSLVFVHNTVDFGHRVIRVGARWGATAAAAAVLAALLLFVIILVH